MSKRRANNEGSVYKHDGRWIAMISVTDPVTGKRRRPRRHAATQEQALELLDDLRGQRRSGVAIDSRMTLSAWLDRWLEAFVRDVKAPATVENYSDHCRLHIVPAIGKVRIGQLKPSHVATLHRVCEAKGLSPSSVAGVHRVLRAALSQAEREGLVQRNVARLQPPPAVRRREVKPPTADQVRAVLDASRGAPDHALYALLATAGLRIGEALALRWDDLDLNDDAQVTVQRKVQRKVGRLIVGPVKTPGSEGRVPLTRLAVQALSEHRRLQAEARLAAPSWADPGLVFPTSIGTQQEPRQAQRRWERLRTELGMPWVRAHDFRHAAASLMLDAGVPLKVVQKVLRHSRLATTADLYTHVTERLERDAADRLDEALGRAL